MQNFQACINLFRKHTAEHGEGTRAPHAQPQGQNPVTQLDNGSIAYLMTDCALCTLHLQWRVLVSATSSLSAERLACWEHMALSHRVLDEASSLTTRCTFLGPTTSYKVES